MFSNNKLDIFSLQIYNIHKHKIIANKVVYQNK